MRGQRAQAAALLRRLCVYMGQRAGERTEEESFRSGRRALESARKCAATATAPATLVVDAPREAAVCVCGACVRRGARGG
jgi:hypothetical protein